MSQTRLANVEKQMETAKVEVQKPFEREEELATKTKRLAVLDALLNMDEKGGEIIGDGDDELAEDAESEDNKGLSVQDDDQTNMERSEATTVERLRKDERVSFAEKHAEMKGRQQESNQDVQISAAAKKEDVLE